MENEDQDDEDLVEELDDENLVEEGAFGWSSQTAPEQRTLAEPAPWKKDVDMWK